MLLTSTNHLFFHFFTTVPSCTVRWPDLSGLDKEYLAGYRINGKLNISTRMKGRTLSILNCGCAIEWGGEVHFERDPAIHVERRSPGWRLIS